MPEHERLSDAWLVAAWPGMGQVAITAAAYLVEQLGAKLVHELRGDEFFDSSHVDVHQGIARAATVPRCMFFESSSTTARRDLLIFVGEAQPSSGGHELCRRIVEHARTRGVTRVVTFAALATQVHPAAQPRVYGAVTDANLLPALRESEVEILEDGQIGGLNGLLLAAGAEGQVPGMCLLGELPFFAIGVQNPKASIAALEVFARLAGVEIDLAGIREASEQVEAAILDLLEQLKSAARQQRGEQEDEFMSDQDEDQRESTAGAAQALDEQDRARLEQLFEQAAKDRNLAFHLKEELDRLGVFEAYEDRFLDLFKRAE